MPDETALPETLRASYDFTTIDVPGSIATSVMQVNGGGEAVGTYRDPNIFDHVFVYENGTYTTLDVPGSSGTGGAPNAGINAAGVIAGNYYNGSEHGFTYANGTFATIDVPGATDTYVTGINNSGQLTGYYLGATGGGSSGAFIYFNGNFTTIPNGIYPAINNRGEIAGEYLSGGSEQGFTYENGTLSTFSAPGALTTHATALNDRGVVAGDYLGSDNAGHGFIYQNGGFATIDAPGATDTFVTGIDNHGDVVGWYTTDHAHGFIDIRGKITTVDVPGAVDTDILGINAQGQLVGLYYDSSGHQYGFIATPSEKPSGFAHDDVSELLKDFAQHIGVDDFAFDLPANGVNSGAGGGYPTDPTSGAGGSLNFGLPDGGAHAVPNHN